LKRSTAALRCQIAQSVAQNSREFVAMARKELEHELQLLNETIPRNEKVIIISGAAKTGFRSRRSSQPEPKGLAAVKSVIGQGWPTSGLLDIEGSSAGHRVSRCFQNLGVSPFPRLLWINDYFFAL
jgi:hypothetical protein